MKKQTIRGELVNARYYASDANTRSVYANDGRHYQVPTEEAREHELKARGHALAGRFLDDADRDYPGFAVTLPPDIRLQHHDDWVKARRAYVLGDDDALERMELFITLLNPPFAADVALPKAPPSKKHRHPSPHLVAFALVVLLALTITVAGIIHG